MTTNSTGQRSASPQGKSIGISEESNGDSFAFLVHSQDTLNNNLPPNLDNQPLARQKRRRTSPEDQATLEAEYEKNSKPDKTARLDIVKRVALGEKEVQIWFQNRRQISRRKSRPFSSQDSAISDVFSSQESSGTSIYSSFSLPDVSEELFSSQSTIQQSQSGPDPASPTSLEAAAEPKTSSAPEINNAADGEPAPSVIPPTEKKLDEPTKDAVNTKSLLDKLAFPPISAVPSGRPRPGVANRHSSSFLIHDDQTKTHSNPTVLLNEVIVKPRNAVSLPSSLRRSSSLLKLSTSFDGKAKVINGSESPSPLKIRAPRPVPGLLRSQSAIEPSRRSNEEIQLPFFRSPKRLMKGRSRDARTWEFYCDNDARDALTEQAEREASGSAAGAIGLIRSRSIKVLLSNSNKVNTHAPKSEPLKPVKADKSKTQKRKLNRTISSVARLQTVGVGKQAVETGQEKPKSSSQSELIEDPGDSDKENWEPGTQTRIHRRRRPVNSATLARRAQSVLKENSQIPSQSSSLDAFLSRRDRTSQPEDKENSGCLGKADDVTALTRDSDLPREPDDLDCVQNLLALREGAWQ